MSDIQTIKDRIDIVQFISEYIQLKKAGVHWKGCCPFHQEKTPSFMVQPDRQFYHCFGCGKGGDIFNFVQEMEGLEFVEALKLLAERAGVKIDTFKSEINKSEKNRILEINKMASYFFNKFLTEMDASQKARDYLLERGMKMETIKEWQVGYIPDQWELLIKYLLKKGFGIEDIVSSGLAIKKDNANSSTGKGYYDRFRGRIMFPISNVHGDIVGFTGRVLIETEKSGGKYVNTPQTLIFDKSRLMFGLDRSKMEIRSKDSAVLVEGQMDVITAHQAGMKNVVAASGTALTIEHVKLLKRYTNNISIAFDTDEAGLKASKRGIDIALQEGMNIKVITIPDGCGKDADECIKKDKQIWFDAVKNATGIMEWYFSINLDKLDLSSPKDKQHSAENILSEIIIIPYAIERDHWFKELSERINVDIDTLKVEAQRIDNQNNKLNYIQDTEEEKPKNNILPVKDRYLLDVENLWAVLVKYPNLFIKYNEQIKDTLFDSTWLLAIYELAKTQYNDNNRIDFDELGLKLSEEIKNNFNILLLQADEFYNMEPEKDLERTFLSILKRVEEGNKKKNISKQII